MRKKLKFFLKKICFYANNNESIVFKLKKNQQKTKTTNICHNVKFSLIPKNINAQVQRERERK